MGYIHSRIKPNNILISDSYEYILSDYSDSMFNGIESNHICDYFYQSPESLCNKSISNKSDMYSIGCILYYLITGEHPVYPLKKNINYEKEILLLLNVNEMKRPNCETILNILNENNDNGVIKYSNYLYRTMLMNECDIKDEIVEEIVENNISIIIFKY